MKLNFLIPSTKKLAPASSLKESDAEVVVQALLKVLGTRAHEFELISRPCGLEFLGRVAYPGEWV